MIINGMNKLTLLDYPEKMACIIFTKGCDFKCPFCQNSSLTGKAEGEGYISEEEVLSYLKKRKNVLDGLVISGGEPTMQKDLMSFIRQVKELGLLVKLDTNGFNPRILEELLQENLVDYVALDIKNDLDNYATSCGFTKLALSNLLKSIDLLKNSHINYEFRTTVMKQYHNEERLANILGLVGDKSKYYIQNFRDSEYVLDHTLEGFTKEELIHIQNDLKKTYPNVYVRGI